MIRSLMRAELEMGDYAAARRRLDALGGLTVRLLRNVDLSVRFEAIGSHLTGIHVLARAGELRNARNSLVEIWPEVEAVLAAGPDFLFNQVQFARALSIRAEIDGSTEQKRHWLERASDYLRPAAAEGKLTHYEREVLLAGIEKQLAALPSN